MDVVADGARALFRTGLDNATVGGLGRLDLSGISAATLRRAHAVHSIAAVQVEYSPLTLGIKDENIILLNRTGDRRRDPPLGRSFLAGQHYDEDCELGAFDIKLAKEDVESVRRLAAATYFDTPIRVADIPELKQCITY
ncbi:hypothetical protein C8Q76DRAFT_795196 [Earliella scabrosa]|nr:hypothetical protein C8Q76DRAFT_795172 [Earliella scabrosa]KAI0716955.1 hypothetical protein C8Q76DRAFT_795196 [Earliella scabrosa]